MTQETRDVAGVIARLYFVAGAIPNLYQSVAIALLVGALLVLDVTHSANLADVGVIVLLLLRAFAYSQQLQQLYHQLIERMPSLALIEQRRALYEANAAEWGSEPLDRIESLELQNVSFCYEGRSRALTDVSVHLDRGQVVGVVGPSGAGKSTLIQILLQLRTPASGTYVMNGGPVERFSADDWSLRVSYLSQDPKLIAGTVAENIRFRRDSTTDAVVAAAKLANVHEDVALLPHGYDTVLALGSTGVSGGQRQRICLARALLMRPDLLILDEPTSALDARSEHLVRDSLSSLRGEMTIVIIAHKLPTLSICDRILVMRDGSVDAFDTPAALAESDGFYRDAMRLSRL
jgi:ABC-type multidrug transport system fused ATPase/permease subunit